MTGKGVMAAVHRRTLRGRRRGRTAWTVAAAGTALRGAAVFRIAATTRQATAAATSASAWFSSRSLTEWASVSPVAKEKREE